MVLRFENTRGRALRTNRHADVLFTGRSTRVKSFRFFRAGVYVKKRKHAARLQRERAIFYSLLFSNRSSFFFFTTDTFHGPRPTNRLSNYAKGTRPSGPPSYTTPPPNFPNIFPTILTFTRDSVH